MIDPIAHKAGQEAAAKKAALDALIPRVGPQRRARLQALATANAGGIPTRTSPAAEEADLLTDELVAALGEALGSMAP